MNYYSALIYGLIQGLTEFLPVSSSGHLALLPDLLEIKDPGLVFDLAMHMGTALSIAVYFRLEIKKYLSQLLVIVETKVIDQDSYYVVNMLVATMATFLFALLLKPIAEAYGRNSFYIAINLASFGVLMFIADHFAPKREQVMAKKIEWKKSIFYGLAQSLAIFPGVSRSGITLTYSRFIGMNREDATTFSFLLALPLIIAGFILKSPELANTGEAFNFITCLFGIGISFVTGLVTIHYFLKMVKKFGLVFFAFYRVVLAIFILAN